VAASKKINTQLAKACFQTQAVAIQAQYKWDREAALQAWNA
jgi:hypothetical protein